MSKRAILYARVSTDEQAEHGYSLAAQITAMHKYAAAHGFTVAAEIIDEGVSGSLPFDKRPVGAQVLTLTRHGDIDAIIAQNVDRISRDIVDLLVLVREWLRAGIEVHTLDVGRISSEFDIMLVIKGWQGSDERAKFRERSMRGRRQKAAQGYVVCCGRPPYGYAFLRDENDRVVNLEIVESEARVVRMIYRWYTEGDDDGLKMTSTAIAKRMSGLRIPTPGESRKGYKRKRPPGIWKVYQICIMLRSEVYAGVWRFGVRIGSSRNKRPESEQITVAVPAIVDREVWEIAQKQLEINKFMSKRNCRREYLLRGGLIHCGCGLSMCGNFSSGHRYYACTWRHNHHAGLEERLCYERAVRADQIEEQVWQYVVALLTDEGKFEQALRQAQQEELEALEPRRHELETIEQMIVEAKQDAEQYAIALTKSSGLVSRVLEEKMQLLDVHYASLMSKRTELQAQMATRQLTDAAIVEAMQFREMVVLGITNPDYETKRQVLEVLKVHVTVSNRIATIECAIPIGAPVSFDLDLRTPILSPEKRVIVRNSQDGGYSDRVPFRSTAVEAGCPLRR